MTTLQDLVSRMSPYDIGAFDPPKPRPKARRPFKWVIRGTVLALVGYILGVLLVLGIRGGNPTDEIAVISGYVVALLGWLAGLDGAKPARR